MFFIFLTSSGFAQRPFKINPSQSNNVSAIEQKTEELNISRKKIQKRSGPSIYGNEWIDFSKTYYRIKVGRDGIYRLYYNELLNSGFPVTSVKANEYQLFLKGKKVPLYIFSANHNAPLTTSDFIEFFGQHNDGTFDSSLYFGGTAWQSQNYYSLFNDTSVYFLTTGANNDTIINWPNNIVSPPAAENYLLFKTLNFTKNYVKGFSSFVAGETDVYFSDFLEGEGFGKTGSNGRWEYYSEPGVPKLVTESVLTPFVYTGIGSPLATLRSTFIGISTNENQFFTSTVVLDVNGQQVVNKRFHGFQMEKFNPKFSSSVLSNGNISVNITVTADNLPNNYYSFTWSHVEIEYPRQLNFDGGSILRFTIPANSNARYLKFTNFSDNGNYVLYDLTNNLRIEGIRDNGFLQFVLPSTSNGGSDRDIYIANESGIFNVNYIYPVQFIDYSVSTNQGNYLIISHPKLFDADNRPVEAYQQYRHSINGGNYNSIIIDINQLYDQFAYGIMQHPLSIVNFLNFALDKWSEKPEYLFIIGKGFEYPLKATCPTFNNIFLVPTFGSPGSDNLFSAMPGSYIPRIATGRLAAKTAQEVSDYLEKIKEYDKNTINESIPIESDQTPENKLWMKSMLHLGGGKDGGEQTTFKNYLENFREVIEDTLYGAKVHSLFKTSTTVISKTPKDFVDSLITSGVSIINFFGHSHSTGFDFNLDVPSNYHNKNKYPLIIANGCYSGEIHECFETQSETFVLYPEKGAIAFLATNKYGIPEPLFDFNMELYRQIGQRNYGLSFGKSIKNAIENVFLNSNSNNYNSNRLTCEQFTLHGDPAINLNAHPLPDYFIDENNILFSPQVVTAKDDYFDVNVEILNLGKAVDRKLHVTVYRTFPDGLNLPQADTIITATKLKDNVSIRLKRAINVEYNGLGLNKICVKVDDVNGIGEIDELSEKNNGACVDLLILSDDAIPIYPYEFSIVSNDAVELKASTANVFMKDTYKYIFEIDTTENFDNSFTKKRIEILSKGGVISWSPKNQSGYGFRDSTVYYWRISLDSTVTHQYNWRNSSFIYIKDCTKKGWNQSHYFQLKKNSFSNMSLNTNRQFSFFNSYKDIGILTHVPGAISNQDFIDFKLFEDGNVKRTFSCFYDVYRTTINLAWFDSTKGEFRESLVGANPTVYYSPGNITRTLGTFGELHTGSNICGSSQLYTFDFQLEDPDTTMLNGNVSWDSIWKNNIINFLNNIPCGSYIAGYLLPNIVVPDNQNKQKLINTFESLGLTKIAQSLSFQNDDDRRPYGFILQKCHSDTLVEELGTSLSQELNLNFPIKRIWNNGNFQTPKIGPAARWHSFHWKYHRLDSGKGDEDTIYVYGIDKNNQEILLQTLMASSGTLLFSGANSINANDYPFLKLKLSAKDDSLKTPVQLDYWRVLYDEIPEAALNASKYFYFRDSSLQQGQDLVLAIAMENVSDTDMDSIKVNYKILNSRTQVDSSKRFDTLSRRDTINSYFTMPIRAAKFRGTNNLFIDMNPNNDQPEMFHFNNVGLLPFNVTGDYYNPLLDVTFDGEHILDGDIVSAQPEILIKLKDENKYLALSDSSVFYPTLIDPIGNPFLLDGVKKFISANPGNLLRDNTAQLELKPNFTMDGKYKLIVSASDIAGNQAGKYDYEISFEIITKPMISNLMNYPNPFTSSTRFVFTLTGGKESVPTFMKIQILTVTGKVVREIMMEELFPDLSKLHQGRNVITDFAWNGTDQYGDKLANGLYLYRIVASFNGKKYERFERDKMDKYFKSGFGKMYLMR